VHYISKSSLKPSITTSLIWWIL